MSRAAQKVARMVSEMGRQNKRRQVMSSSGKELNNVQVETSEEAQKPKRRRAAKKAVAEKAPKPRAAAKERDPLAGLRAAPKLKGLLLGTDISRVVVAKALAAHSFDGAEAVEARRLLARLEARK